MASFEEISKVIAKGFNLTNKKTEKNTHHYKEIFNFDEKEIFRILDIVIERIPHSIFLDENKKVKDAISPIIAKELVMFLSRTDPQSEYFDNDLLNFRDEIVSMIVNDVYVK